MHCASCVNVLERALKRIPGVSQANVNLANNKATVTGDENVTEEILKTAVAGVGYEIVTNKPASAEASARQEELNDLQNKVICWPLLSNFGRVGLFTGPLFPL